MLRNKLMCSIVCSNAYTRAVAPHYKTQMRNFSLNNKNILL